MLSALVIVVVCQKKIIKTYEKSLDSDIVQNVLYLKSCYDSMESVIDLMKMDCS